MHFVTQGIMLLASPFISLLFLRKESVMNKQKQRRQQLHDICNDLHFDTMPQNVIQCYEDFPYDIDGDLLTDDFVLGVQEFATILTHVYHEQNMPHLAELPCVYASAVIYAWWKVNVRDNVFKEKEIDV